MCACGVVVVNKLPKCYTAASTLWEHMGNAAKSEARSQFIGGTLRRYERASERVGQRGAAAAAILTRSITRRSNRSVRRCR